MKTKLIMIGMAGLAGIALAQEAARTTSSSTTGDPYIKAASGGLGTAGGLGAGEETEDRANRHIGALIEYIQVDARTANKLVRKHAASPSAEALREELEVLIDDGSADLIETCYVKSANQQRAKVESIEEKIYPTEFDPPEIPQTVNLNNASGPGTAANPTAFEMRPIGATLEVEGVISPGGRFVDINIAPELVQFLGREYTVEERDDLTAENPRTLSSTIYQPQFYTMKQSTTLSIADGDTVLLSLNRPGEAEGKMVMVLLRVDILK